jgi:hypothetical protein
VHIGDAVKVTTGPFAGLHGLLKAFAPRVVITVELPARRLDVEMDLDWICAAEFGCIPALGIKESTSRIRVKGA